jgi:hypothetical protein
MLKMCNPALALMAIGTGVQVYGQQQEAKQQESWNKYQTKQAQADANAERGAAEVDADRIRKAARQRASAANAASAASGVKTGAGTAQLIQDDVIGSAEEDAQMTIFNGRDAGSRLDAQGEAFKIEGKQARSNANMQSAATVFNSGAEMYSKWKTM